MYRKSARGNLVLWVEVAVVLIIVSGTGGFALARLTAPHPAFKGLPTDSSGMPQPILVNDPIFSTQTAVIEGTITNVEGDKATVTSQKGKGEPFTVSKTVQIYPSSQNPKNPYPLWGISNLPLNQNVLINLQLTNGEYIITTVSFPPQLSPSNSASISAPNKK